MRNSPKVCTHMGANGHTALAGAIDGAARQTPEPRTYEHRFASGNRARIHIDAGDPWGQRVEWDRLPIAEADEAEYVAWRKEIGCAVAEETGLRGLFVLLLRAGMLLLLCGPGGEVHEEFTPRKGGAQ